MEQLADYFATRLRAELPFLERVVGIARPRTTQEPNGEALHRVTLPLPVSFTAAECAADARYLMPDERTTGVCFFEDQGSSSYEPLPGVSGYETSLRLLCWFNYEHLSAPLSEAQLLVAVSRAFRVRQRHSTAELLDILAILTPLPANAQTLFARYSYVDSPLLYPPFRVAGFDIKVKWRPAPDCLPLPADDGFPYRYDYYLD